MIIKLILEIKNSDDLEKIIDKINSIKGINIVEREN